MNELKDLIIKKFNFEEIEYEISGLKNEHVFFQMPWYEYLLLKHIKDLNLNGVYVDVGANIGNHSLFFLNHCKSTKIYVFEPENFCYNILSNNLSKNTKKEYCLYKQAIWNKETYLKLVRFESFDNMGMSKLIEVDNCDEKELLVKADSIDNMISYNENVVLLKIDAEGSEPYVLEGAINTIIMNMPVIVCEASTELEFNKINEILLPLGYKKPTMQFNSTPTYVWVKKQ